MVKQNVKINQSVAILCDGNNIELSIHSEADNRNTMINFDTLIPKLLDNRGLNRLIYFREGKAISDKLAGRLHQNFYGSVIPCHKTADIPLSIKATQLASKVDTIIIMSGDSDYIELVRHLKSEGVRVEIAAVRATTSAMLIKEADYFHAITKNDWFVLNSRPRNNSKRNHSNSRTQFVQKKDELKAPVVINDTVIVTPPKLENKGIKKDSKPLVTKSVVKKETSKVKKPKKESTKREITKKETKKKPVSKKDSVKSKSLVSKLRNKLKKK